MKNRLILLVVLWTMTLPVRAVTYGTHSTVYTPAVSSPVMHTAAPTMHMRSTSAMPMMTHGATASYAASSSGASSPSRPIGHIRRVKPTDEGGNRDPRPDADDPSITWYWDEEEEDWVSDMPVGTIRDNGGVIEEWNGSEWVPKSQIADLGTPVGDAPWLCLLLLCTAYALFLGWKVRSERVNE